MKELFGDKKFLKIVFSLAIPIIIQNFIMASLGTVDVLMVGKLGEKSLAAVSTANQFFYILQWLLIAMTGSASIFGAQYWGKKDLNGVKTSFLANQL